MASSATASLTSDRSLIIWLFSTCFLIWLMIMLGGATRLTHSGLSIVEWKPITGIIPPLNHTQWIEEFEKYKQFPEYKLINKGMSLSSFQFIYYMEYAHRLLGRLMGLWFIIPFLFFWLQKRLSPLIKRRALIALALGLSQGILGWFMVKSGLIKDPSVSHYRLTAHLVLAVTLYGLLFWTALELIYPKSITFLSPDSRLIRRLSLTSLIFIILTIIYGGFVAGLKAGLIYNTFPLMGGQFIPSEWAFYSPLWRNFAENAALVQFIHRWLALSTISLILYTTWKTRTVTTNVHIRRVAWFFAIAAILQAILGILTLLHQVPISLGTLHQGTAIILISLSLYFLYIGKGDAPPLNFHLGSKNDLV